MRANKTDEIHILAVDDDAVIRKMFESILRGKGYHIHLARNGVEGLEIAEKTDLNLIFLDIMMPVMDGFATLKALRESPRNANIPIIIVTAKSDMATLLRAIKLGANDFVAKPFTRSDLLQKAKFAIDAVQNATGEGLEDPVILQKKNTFIDARMFHRMQARFAYNFDDYFNRLVRLITGEEKMELIRALEGLQDTCELYEFMKAQKKISQMLALVKKEAYEETVKALDDLYLNFEELQRKFRYYI